jgi:hypothetical protein
MIRYILLPQKLPLQPRSDIVINLVRLALAFALLLPLHSLAQNSGGGTIQGTIKDSSSGVIPGAKVSITHIETGVKTSGITNHEGFFAFPPVPTGRYLARFEAAGMKASEQILELQTGQTIDLVPILNLGQSSETVTVSSAIPLVNTTDPTDATTLDAKRIGELPINGRDLNTLLADVTPGVEQVIDVNGGIRTGGLMVYATDYTQDGASANNREFGGSTGLQGLNSIAEVRVETSTGNAKSASPTSVIISSRGGANLLRANVFETIRNNAWGVAKHREDINPNGTPFRLPKLIRNEYGGWVGGPVMVPAFGLHGRKFYDGRNRTFWAASRDETALRQGVTKNYSVPTVAQRSGNFTGLQTSTGLPITLYNPLTGVIQQQGTRNITVRQPFPNNVIPASLESPLAKYVYGITPLPNDITEPNIAPNIKYSFGTNGLGNVNDNPTTIRIDHRLSNSDNFFVKANWGTRVAYFQGTGGATGVPTANREANVTYLPMRAWGSAFSETHIFKPTLFVETLLNRVWQTTQTVNGPLQAQQNWASTLGLPNPYGQIGWPSLLNVGSSYAQYVEGDNRRALGSTITTAQQNYSWIRSNHTIQFGWTWHDEVQRLEPDQGNISGTANFNSLATALESPTLGSNSAPSAVTNTGFDAANFFLGYAANYNVYLSRGVVKMDQRTFAAYLQDNYRVTSRLTLTPGIRWDMAPGFHDEHYLVNTFDRENHAIVLAQPLGYYYRIGATTPQVVANFQKVNVKLESAADIGRSSQLFASNNFNFGPRIGAAYRALDGRKSFVIRGGYGLYYSNLPIRTLLAQFSSSAPFKASYSYNPNSAAQSPDGNSNFLLTHAPTFVAGLNSATSVDVASPTALGIGQSVTGIASDFPTSRVHEWNAEIEKQIGASMVLRIKYDGKHGSDLDQLNNINPQAADYIYYSTTLQPTPSGSYSSVARRPYDQTAYTTINYLSKTGMSNSSMGVLEFDKRFSHGLQFQAFYTLMNAYRLAGNSFRDSPGTTPAQYLPGAVPSDPAALNRFLNYQRDTGIPRHRVRWNWIYDLPFGRGRSFIKSPPRWLNSVIGGWTMTGSGTVVSTWFALDAADWNFQGQPEVYGTKYKITDCSATPATAKTAAEERCYAGYLYWNGYISQKLINSVNAHGIPNGIEGLPANYKPASTPLVPWPVGGKPTDANAADYDTNYVYITLNNGARQRVLYDTGLNPWRHQYLRGPFNWNMDSSLRKNFKLKEGVNLRVTFDVFNVFNLQGLNTPGINGIASLQNSYTGFGFQPRQAQASFKLDF